MAYGMDGHQGQGTELGQGQGRYNTHRGNRATRAFRPDKKPQFLERGAEAPHPKAIQAGAPRSLSPAAQAGLQGGRGSQLGSESWLVQKPAGIVCKNRTEQLAHTATILAWRYCSRGARIKRRWLFAVATGRAAAMQSVGGGRWDRSRPVQ
jgi:hypothetical protein